MNIPFQLEAAAVLAFIYVHGDSLTCCLPVTPSNLGIDSPRDKLKISTLFG